MSEVNSSESTSLASVLETPSPASSSETPSLALPGGWHVVGVKARVDSFSQGALIEEIRKLREQGQKRIALDMKANRFLSLPAIRYCTDAARELLEAGGALALIACSQKTKRHFEVYGSLKHMKIVRNEKELEAIQPQLDV